MRNYELPENVSTVQYAQAVAFQKAFGRCYTDLTERGLEMALAFSLRDPSLPLPTPRRAATKDEAHTDEERSKLRGAKGGKLKRCGKCGHLGHNARTCGKPTDKWGRKAKGQNTCGNCGGKGHNARTCSK